MRGEGRLGDAVVFVPILAGLLLTVAALASSLTSGLNPRRAMEPESWAESMCASRLGPSGEETLEFDGCRRDALAMPPWRLDLATLSAATSCFAAAVVVAAMRHARGGADTPTTRRRTVPLAHSGKMRKPPR